MHLFTGLNIIFRSQKHIVPLREVTARPCPLSPRQLGAETPVPRGCTGCPCPGPCQEAAGLPWARRSRFQLFRNGRPPGRINGLNNSHHVLSPNTQTPQSLCHHRKPYFRCHHCQWNRHILAVMTSRPSTLSFCTYMPASDQELQITINITFSQLSSSVIHAI